MKMNRMNNEDNKNAFIEDAILTFPAGTHSTGNQKFLEMFGKYWPFSLLSICKSRAARIFSFYLC